MSDLSWREKWEVTHARRKRYAARAIRVEVPFNDPTTRTYRARRDQWGRVQCHVRDAGSPRALDSIGHYSQSGFELGCACNGSRDLALSILCDHLAVSPCQALAAFRNGFHTLDIRLLYIWMAHERLVEQVLGPTADVCEVTEWALDRLLRRGFVNGELEERFRRVVEEREKVKLLDGGKYERVSRAGEYSKPQKEVL